MQILEEEVDYEDEDHRISADESDEEAVDIADEYRITSFGIDYDVDGIVRRLTKGKRSSPSRISSGHTCGL